LPPNDEEVTVVYGDTPRRSKNGDGALRVLLPATARPCVPKPPDAAAAARARAAGAGGLGAGAGVVGASVCALRLEVRNDDAAGNNLAS